MTSPDVMAKGIDLGNTVFSLIGDWQQNAPRTQQSTARVLGMSEMGGCREYIRATIAGDPKGFVDPLKWPAFLGTAIGDKMENILAGYGYITQEEVRVRLPKTGIEVGGHLDFRDANSVGDFKTKDGVDDIVRDGPSFKEKAQISGYLVGLVQQGKLGVEATGHLVYIDRSGRDNEPYVWSISYPDALLVLEAVDERLLEVATALTTGLSQSYLRDEPESWCYNVGCPFYKACWDGYTPTGKIEHERELENIAKFVQARAESKASDNIRRTYREELRGVSGVVERGPHRGTTVQWSLSQNESGRMSERLDVREPREKQ